MVTGRGGAGRTEAANHVTDEVFPSLGRRGRETCPFDQMVP